MANEALQEFVAAMDDVVANHDEPADRAAGAAKFLPDLLAHPEFLSSEHRAGSPDRYTQHVVHVHASGAYSIVALVWLPGQRTPVHDHRCWCVVGVMEGAEREIRYHLVSDGAEEWLTEQEVHRNPPGSVSTLVPPEENIHVVENSCNSTAVSIHVYGDDIATLGSSVNQVFTQPVLEDSGRGTGVAWRPRTAR